MDPTRETPVRDRLARPLRSLRLSVTDRCNLRCSYCMPEEEYVWLPRGDLLDFDELGRVCGVFAGLGVERVRLTGGEPLLRRELPVLVEVLAGVAGIRDLALTTNALRLAGSAAALRAAGLQRVTVSLDTLDPVRFRRLTGRDTHAQALQGLEAAARAGFARLKLNTVVVRGFNDDELVGLIERGRALARHGTPVEVRFIEYMDVGGATRWSPAEVVSREEVLDRLGAAYGAPEPVLPVDEAAPARRYRLPDGTTFGVIASTTRPFCRSCDRCRLTADGRLFLCLYAREGLDLRGPLRAGASDAELAELIRGCWAGRDERGAEERLRLARRRTPLALAGELRRDPHLEMHTRGG